METLHRPGDYLSRAARLLEIDARLRDEQLPSHASLAREFDVSVRTLQRDFDYLRDTLGAPLEYDATRKGWRYASATWALPAVFVSAADLEALLLMREAVSQYAGTPYAEAARRAFELIERALPMAARRSAAWVRERVAFTDLPAAAIRREVWDAVLAALRSSITLELTYARPGERASRRRIDPWGLIVSQGSWYLHGHDHRHEAPRTFLLARARAARPTGRRFTPPAGFRLSDYTRAGFAGLQADGEPPRRVRLTFTREASARAAERPWHAGQSTRRDRQGRLVIEFEVRAPFLVENRIAAEGNAIERVEWRSLAGDGEPPRG